MWKVVTHSSTGSCPLLWSMDMRMWCIKSWIECATKDSRECWNAHRVVILGDRRNHVDRS